MFEVTTAQQVQDMARGAVFLGSGGGGDPYVGELFLRNQIEQGHRPRIVDPASLPADALVVGVAGIGAPTVLVEHLLSERALVALVDEAASLYGRPVDALISVEIGGCNSLVPLGVGACVGLPVVDADGMGRAFPHLEMTSFSVAGRRSTPALLRDDRGNSARITLDDDRSAEHVARSFAATLGGLVHSIVYPLSAQAVVETAVPGTLTATLEIGRRIREARGESGSPVAALLDYLDDPATGRRAIHLHRGKVVDIRHETRDGWHWGEATITAQHDPADQLVIGIQNEYIVARRGGRAVVCVPDIIAVLDQESAEPLTAEQLRYGQRVDVIGYSAHPIMWQPAGLDVFGPSAFRIADPYRGLDLQLADAA
jgi:DUF917 family protein